MKNVIILVFISSPIRRTEELLQSPWRLRPCPLRDCFQVKVFWLKFLEVYISSTSLWILLILYLLLDIGLKFNSLPS